MNAIWIKLDHNIGKTGKITWQGGNGKRKRDEMNGTLENIGESMIGWRKTFLKCTKQKRAVMVAEWRSADSHRRLKRR